MKQCPICKKHIKQLTPLHIKKCFTGDNDYRIKYINHNFPLTINYKLIEKLYNEDKYSLPMLCSYFGGLDLKSMCTLLNYHNIQIRTIKETRRLSEYKNRIETTNLERFGAINPLSRDTEVFHRRNKTVLQKYGVENVWQCVDVFMKFPRSQTKISYLNKRIYKILDDTNIKYTPEFALYYLKDNRKRVKFYDFKIDNILLEVNGDYWHANPINYSPTDILNFPRYSIKAEEIWNRDLLKKQIGEENGFKIITLWETELNKMNDNEILQYIKNQIN